MEQLKVKRKTNRPSNHCCDAQDVWQPGEGQFGYEATRKTLLSVQTGRRQPTSQEREYRSSLLRSASRDQEKHASFAKKELGIRFRLLINTGFSDAASTRVPHDCLNVANIVLP